MEINKNEIRLGNYALNENNKIIQLDEVRFIILLKGKVKYQPIPLTEEVLLRCGFEKIGEWFCKNDLNISIIHDKTTFGCNEEYEIPNVKFLHTLQNLYFALTGKELTYNHS